MRHWMEYVMRERALLLIQTAKKLPSTMTIIRRLGPDPHANGKQSLAKSGCPDILELADGDFLVVGIDCTAEAIGRLPVSAGCGPDERIVRVPRATLVHARADIPARV